MLTATPYITEMFRYIALDVEAKTGIQVHYVHGTKQDIDNELNAFQSTGNSQYKWPGIFLIQPFTETESDIQGVDKDCEFKIVIAHMTDANYSPDQREALSFVPTLRPIYRQLIESIRMAGYFAGSRYGKIAHKATDLYQWGEAGSAVFCDHVDAIFIEGLQLSVKEFNCT